jgi:hypothetical protein
MALQRSPLAARLAANLILQYWNPAGAVAGLKSARDVGHAAGHDDIEDMTNKPIARHSPLPRQRGGRLANHQGAGVLRKDGQPTVHTSKSLFSGYDWATVWD